jgi:O-antigen/teichoic acid export membrane protein
VKLAPRSQVAKTGLALVVNSGVTSVLGVVYWIAVARKYTRGDLADNAAVISTMLTLGGITQMNLVLSMGALLPRAGRRAGRLLIDMYLAVIVFSLAAYVVFIVLIRPHLPYFDRVVTGPLPIAALGVVFAVYNLFVLQDGALAALGSATVVPFENAAFGGAKLVMVVALAGVLPHQGVIVSWTVPAAVLVIPITWYIFRRVLPQHTVEPTGAIRLLHAMRPVAGDYVGFLFLISSTLALPAIAVSLVGADRAAAFSVPWLVSASIDTVASNLGMALTIEKSRTRDRNAMTTRTTLMIFGLVAAIALIVGLAAPLLLRLYGGTYAADGVVVLRLLVLAAPFRALAVLSMSEARSHGRTGYIIGLQAMTSIVVISVALALTRGGSIKGIAVAWLLAQVLAAICSLRRRRRRETTAVVLPVVAHELPAAAPLSTG